MPTDDAKPWAVYTVSNHTLIDRYATFTEANERKRRMAASGVPCLVTNRALRTAELRVVRKPLTRGMD